MPIFCPSDWTGNVVYAARDFLTTRSFKNFLHRSPPRPVESRGGDRDGCSSFSLRR